MFTAPDRDSSAEPSSLIMNVSLIAEVKDTDIREKIKYRYHYMNENRKMIFRYDNAPHHRHVGRFPHHKHISDSVKESSEPDLKNILFEIAHIARENT